MNKILLIGFSALILASCISISDDKANSVSRAPEEQSGAVLPVAERAVDVADADFEMYRKNIIVKTMGEDYIVYEYSNVRVDKVAPLASRYCYETNPGKKAYLRDIYMHKNHKRRATFDCVDLASE